MQTHRDDDAELALERLRMKAQQMTAAGANRITAGHPDEKDLGTQECDGVTIRRMPADPLCLRISIGEAPALDGSAYLVFRGDPGAVLALLDRAAAALRRSVFCG